MPLIAMMYPRGPKINDEKDPEVVAHAARLGAELGADIIKTNYTGDPDTFKEVVKGCPAPIVIAGVITSYSIHYTKLYEEVRDDVGDKHPGLQSRRQGDDLYVPLGQCKKKDQDNAYR